MNKTQVASSEDLARGLPVVLDDGTNTYVYGLDLIAAIDGAGVETYFTYDGLGSTADLTDDTATVTDTYSYDVFGDASHDSGSSDNDWLFTGEQEDGDSGLYYLRARHYDPATGRFLSQDPYGGVLGWPQTQEPYSYTASSPVNRIDPSGMYFIYGTGGVGDPRPSKEGGFGEGGLDLDDPLLGGVNRGNLRPCKGGIEHMIKEKWPGIGGHDAILCDENGRVYVQYYFLKKGQWLPGELEDLGELKDYQSAGWGFGVPGGISQLYSQPGIEFAIVAAGGSAAAVWWATLVNIRLRSGY